MGSVNISQLQLTQLMREVLGKLFNHYKRNLPLFYFFKYLFLQQAISLHTLRPCRNFSNICAMIVALAALAGSQLRTSNTNRQQPAANNQTHEMTVPNELIGCIIGKGGTKIAEIRQISGAMIRISNCEEREGGATDRTITITGNPDAVALAQYLINMR